MLVLAGAGPELGPLRAEARALGVEERTVFLGHRSDVAELLACCDMFVLPSLNEGLPLSVLEAMAACRPVVATNVGGTREAIIDGVNGLLVPPADPASLATAINRFLADTELTRTCAAAAYTRVTHDFSTTMMVERNARIYAELLPG
jgi:glycosyltransferase involved in cell wall biosynthesis